MRFYPILVTIYNASFLLVHILTFLLTILNTSDLYLPQGTKRALTRCLFLTLYFPPSASIWCVYGFPLEFSSIIVSSFIVFFQDCHAYFTQFVVHMNTVLMLEQI
jgi:hypothetical protein